MNGKAVIFSAPSGSGKTTLVKRLLEEFPSLQFSISATTRAPRKNEIDGVDYFFMSIENFEHRIKSGDFIEFEEVYKGTYYGTLQSEVTRIWESEGVITFDVDVIGGSRLKQYFKENALAIFIKPPSLQELEKRLRNRATDDDESILKRIGKASKEMGYQSEFDEIILNDEIETAVDALRVLLTKFLNQ